MPKLKKSFTTTELFVYQKKYKVKQFDQKYEYSVQVDKTEDNLRMSFLMPTQPKSSKSDFEKPGRQIAHCTIPIYEMLQDQSYE